MLSDRIRVPALLAIVLALAALCVAYGRFAAARPVGWRACLADPLAHDGDAIVLSVYTITRIDGPDRYEVSKTVRGVPVLGPTEGLERGLSVSVVGTFDARRRAVVESRRVVHRLRPVKQALGLVALVAGLFLAPRAWRWRAGRLEDRTLA